MTDYLQTLVKRCENECSWKHSADSKTCLKQDDINIIAKSLNTTNTHIAINKALPDCKGSEFCWVKQTGNMEKLGDNFKPVKIEDKKNDWLWNIDIDKALSSSLQENSSFKAFKAVPSNFLSMNADDIWFYQSTNVRNLNLQKELEKGYKSIGMVFNTSPSTRPGKHWVCMYIDIPRNTAYYYDSAGKPPLSQVVEFVNQMPSKPKLIHNKIKNQYKNIDCGMYCLYMLSGLSNGYSFDNLVQYAPNDDFINKLRKAFFLKEETNKMLMFGGSASYPKNEYLYLRLLLKNCDLQLSINGGFYQNAQFHQIGGGFFLTSDTFKRIVTNIVRVASATGGTVCSLGTGGGEAVTMGFTVMYGTKVMNKLNEIYKIVKEAKNLGEHALTLTEKAEAIYNQTAEYNGVRIFDIEDIFDRADMFVKFLDLPDSILKKYCNVVDGLFDTVAETLGSLLSTAIPNDGGMAGIALQEYLINFAKKEINEEFIQKLDQHYQKLDNYNVPLQHVEPSKVNKDMEDRNKELKNDIKSFKEKGKITWKNMIDNHERMAEFMRIITKSLKYMIDSDPKFFEKVKDKLSDTSGMMLAMQNMMLSLVSNISPTAGTMLGIASSPGRLALKTMSVLNRFTPVGMMMWAADSVIPSKLNPKTQLMKFANSKVTKVAHHVLDTVYNQSELIAKIFSSIMFIAVVLFRLMQNCLKNKTKDIKISSKGFFSRFFSGEKKTNKVIPAPQEIETSNTDTIASKKEDSVVMIKNSALVKQDIEVEKKQALYDKVRSEVKKVSELSTEKEQNNEEEDSTTATTKERNITGTLNKMERSMDKIKKGFTIANTFLSKSANEGIKKAKQLYDNAKKIQEKVQEVNEVVSNSNLPASIKNSVGTIAKVAEKGTKATKKIQNTVETIKTHADSLNEKAKKGIDMTNKIQANIKTTKEKLEGIKKDIDSGNYKKLLENNKVAISESSAVAARTAGGNPYIYYSA